MSQGTTGGNVISFKILKRISLLIVFSSFVSFAQKNIIWSPIFDQGCQQIWEYHQKQPDDTNYPAPNPKNNKDFAVFLTLADISKLKDTITQSIQVAYKKGFRVIDINYYGSFNRNSNSGPNPAALDFSESVAHEGEYWLEQVDNYNKNKVTNGDYLKVRLRIPVYQGTLDWMLNRSNPTLYADMMNYITRNPTYAENGDSDGFLNISLPAIRNYICDYVGIVIDNAKAYLAIANKTKIESVTLTLGSEGESGLYGYHNEGNNRINFTPTPLCSLKTFKDSIDNFIPRQNYLKEMYKEFADVVHSKGLKAGIFIQTLYFDEQVRGAYDLFSLLDNTGIDKLHVTLLVQKIWNCPDTITYNEYLRQISLSRTACQYLNIPFDVEFSWPHYNYDCVSGQNENFNENNLTRRNANSFYNQAKAGFASGAEGVTYCNWAMSVIRQAHDLLQAKNSFGTPKEWRKILGDYTFRWYKNIYDNKLYSFRIGFDSTYLNCDSLKQPVVPYSFYKKVPDTLLTDAGILSTQVNKELSTATKAIYLSDFGRLKWVIKAGSNLPKSGYLNWFDELSLSSTLQSEKIDIITDGIIKKYPDWYKKYTVIYLPFETSGLVSDKVINLMSSISPSDKNKFKYQTLDSNNGSGTFNDWMTQVTIYKEFPRTLSAIPELQDQE